MSNLVFDQGVAQEYSKKFADIREELDKGYSLTTLDRAVITNYYDYISASGHVYGAAANHIVYNEGEFGTTANKYFELFLGGKGYSADEISSYQNKFMVDLALRDSSMRLESLSSDGSISYINIKEYHLKSLDDLGLPREAWGGAFLDVFAGAGASMELGGFDYTPDILQMELSETLVRLALGEEVVKDGVDARESLTALLKSRGIDTDEISWDSGAALIDSLNVIGGTYANNYENYKYFWDAKLEYDWENNPVIESGSIKEGMVEITLQDLYNRYEDYKISEIYSNLGGSEGYEVFENSEIENLATNNNSNIGDVSIGDYAYIDGSFYRKVGLDKYIKDNYPTYDNEADTGYVNINGDEYNANSGDLSSLNDTKLLAEGESLDITVVENPDGSQTSFVKETEVTLADGMMASSVEVVNMDQAGKQAAASFMNNQFVKDVISYVSEPERVGSWMNDVIRLVANGEEIDDIIKFIAVKEIVNGSASYLVNEIIFDEQTIIAMHNIVSGSETGILSEALDSVSEQLADFMSSQSGAAFGNFLTSFVASVVLSEEGLNREEYFEQAAQIVGTQVAEHIALDALKDSFVEGVNPVQGAAAGGVVAAVVYMAAKGIGDIFAEDHMNSHQWRSAGNMATAIGVAYFLGHLVFPIIGGMLASALVPLLFGGKEFNEGEYPNPYDFLKFTDKEDGSGQTIYGLETDGVVARARDGYDDDIVGTDGADTLIGGDGTNQISSGDGNDHIEGRDSDDVLIAGAGNDLVEAGAGDDFVFGGEGSDIIYAGSGDDQIDSGDGNDIVYGESGDDVIVAGTGDDVVYGGDGADQISAGDGDDVAQGGAGIDTILGEAGDDIIYGGEDNDQLYGGSGADLIVAGSGADTVYGEEDDDTIIGGAGIDMLYGDAGADLIAGGDADDLVMGGLGNDILGGGAGADTILGEIGDDQIVGGDGADDISGGAGYDTIMGGLGNDTLDGGADSDFYVFNAGDGFDEITDSAGDLDVIRFVDLASSDVSFTKSGDDLVISFAGNSADQVTIKNSFSGDTLSSPIENLEFTSTGSEGGDSIDLTALSYDSGAGDFSFSITDSVAEDTDIQHVLIQDSEGQLTALDNFYHDSEGYTLGSTEDNYLNVDYEFYNEVEWRSFKKARGSFGGHYTVWYKYYESNIDGTTGADRLVGSWWDENITGSLSADYLYGNNGEDVIYGEAGNDFIEGGSGADYLYGGAGDDIIEGAGGSDIIDGGDGDDKISTGEGSDQVAAGAGNNVIIAEFGNNIITAGDGDNQVESGTGNDQVELGDGDNQISSGDGDNIIIAGDGTNKIVSGDGADTITVGDGNNQIDSGDGADEIVTGSGNNFIYAGDGNDQVTVSGGNNTIYAGSGDDVVEVGDGDNVIYLGIGDDQLTVGGGNNVIVADSGNNVITVLGTSSTPLPDQATLSPTSPQGGSNEDEEDQGTLSLTSTQGGSNEDEEDQGTLSLTSTQGGSNEDDGSAVLSYSPLEGESESGIAEGEDGSGEGQVFFSSITTSSGDDNITISNGNSFIDSGDGNDAITLNNGDHEFIAGDGDNSLSAGSGNSVITMGDGDNVINLNYELVNFDSNYYLETYSDFIPELANIPTEAQAEFALNHFQTIGKYNNYNPNSYINLSSYALSLATQNIELAEGQTPYDYLVISDDRFELLSGDNVNESEEENSNNVTLGDGDNIIYGDNTIHNITLGDGDNQIVSGRGDDSIVTGDGDNQIASGHGDDSIITGDGDNQIASGRGNDSIITGDGDNVIIYEKGDGSDEITVGGGNNIIQLVDLNLQDITITKANNDLLITITETGEVINLLGYSKEGEESNISVHFSDGSIVELDNLTIGSQTNDELSGSEIADQILADSGMDSLLGYAGNDYLAGDSGDDVIFGGTDADLLYGGSGNDYLDSGSGDDTLISGTGDDKMFGGSGSDKFVITKSPGSTDKITDFNILEDTLDLSEFSREFIDIKSLQNKASLNDQGDLVLDLGNEQSLVLEGPLPDQAMLSPTSPQGGSNESEEEQVTLSPTSSQGGSDESEEKQVTLSSADSQWGSDEFGDIDLSSFNIKFSIEEIEGLTGSNSNDIISGTDEDDEIVDGLGLDIVTGGSGADKFVITHDAGATDIITDFTIGEDRINLDSFNEIDFDQLQLTQSGDDAVIGFMNQQKLILRNINIDDLSSTDFKFDVFDSANDYTRYQGEYDFAGPELKSNLIAYYNFDETNLGLDASGNNKHGSVIGDVKSIGGISGNAGFFDGDDKIEIEAFRNFDWGSNFSVSVWFQKTGEFGNYQGIVNNGYFNNGSFEIRTGSENGATRIGGGVLTESNPESWDHDDMSASITEWHHTVMSYDGTNLSYYLDGELQDISNNDSGDLLIRDTVLTIGQAGYGKEDEYFHGAIDELSLFDKALSAEDAALLYGNQMTYTASGSSTIDGIDAEDLDSNYDVIGKIDTYDDLNSNLLAYYNFDEMDKGYDSSGNNRHGSTTGDITSVTGISGNAGFFNGNDKIDVGAFSNFDWGSDFTVSVWFQRTGEFGNYQGIVNNGYYNNGSWEIRMGDEGYGTMLGGGVRTDGNSQSWDHINLTASQNQWHHVVMSYDGENLAYYLDGALKDISDRDSGDMLIQDTVLTIGQAGEGKSNEYFYGAIDELSIYDKSLTANEAYLLYSNQAYTQPTSDDDYVFTGVGDDVITANSGDDEVSAGAGNDAVYGGLGDDLLNGGLGNDYLDSGYGADRLYGAGGDDYLISSADAQDNLLSGGSGDDHIVTLSGNNVIDGGLGNDTITAGTGNDTIYGNSGVDDISGGDGSDLIYGGEGDDTINGESGDDYLIGGLGDDILNGGLGSDRIEGSEGNDILAGNAGNDILIGGAGDDVYLYNIEDGYDQIAIGDVSAESNDVIRFGPDIAKSDLIFQQIEDNLVITFKDQDGGLTLANQFTNNQIKALEFDNGDIVDLSNLLMAEEDQLELLDITGIAENFNGLLELENQTIWVNPINDAPVTEEVTTELDEDNSLLIDVLSSVSDIDDNSADLTLTISKASNGTATLTTGNQILYIPDSDFYGEDELTYTVTDSAGLSSTNKISITVNNIGDVPLVVDNVQLIGSEDKTITIDPNEFGYDADGDELYITSVDAPLNGVAVISDGKIIYTPNADYNGLESFSYVVSDGENELTKTINLTIEAENDAPVITSSMVDVNEDGVTIIDILRDVLDSDSTTLAVNNISQPFFGTAELVDNKIIYIPDSDYNGNDFLIYTIEDGNGGYVTERLDITVNNINDAPILQTITGKIAEDNMLIIDVLQGSFDIDGDELFVIDVGGSEHGVATIIDNKIIYMANDNYHGMDSLEYIVSDGNGAEVAKTLDITIDPVNDTPIAFVASITTNEDEEVSVNIADLISDIDGDEFKRDNILVGTALYGAVTLNAQGEIIYKPNENYFGTDSFTYSVRDESGAYSNQAAIEVNILGINDAPIALENWRDPAVRAGEKDHIVLPNNLFQDLEGNEIILSLTMADGSEIPEWLYLDAERKIIVTNPSDSDLGKLDLILSASDGEFTTDKEFSLAINEPLTVRENKKINIIEGGDDADLVTSESGVSDVIFAGGGDDNIVYNIDDLWGEGYSAENAYSGERINLSGKIRSYDAFDGGDGDDTLYLTDGDDSIFLDDLISDNGTISGSRLFGIEIINALGGSDVIDLSSNIFTYGSVELNGSDGNDVLWSNDGNDQINAGGGDDNIHGGAGDDTINGGLGQDRLTGGSGSDIFDFTGLDESVQAQADIITDFESGADFIHLIDLGLSFTDLEISNDGSSTFVNDNNSDFSIEFHGIVDLSESDFVFGS